MSFNENIDSDAVSVSQYERWASMGRPDLVKPLLRSVTNQAESILNAGKKRGGTLTDSEERQVDSLIQQAQHAKELVEQANESRDRMLKKYPNMWSESQTDSPEWLEFKRGLPTKMNIPIGNGFSRRVVKDGRVETRDLLVSSAGTVPTRVFDELLTRMVLQSGVLASNVRMVTTTTGENILMPRLTAFGTAALISEGGSFGESDPTINSSITMGAFKYGNLLQISDELIQDSAFDIERFVGQALGTQIGQSVASALITGTGTAQPEGIMTNCTVGVTSGTGVSGVPTIANVLSLYASLPAQYRDGSSFVMHPSTYAGIVALNDTTGRSLVLPDLTSAQPLQMLGRPVYLDTNVATTATNAKSIYFGNLAEHFAIRMVNTVQVVSSPDFAFANGLVTLRSMLRLDSKALNDDAARCFKGASS
jgi:HK97 family phage major capsid protein